MYQIPENNKQDAKKNILTARAILPASTFSKGPTSGTLIGQSQHQQIPFIDQQSVQGFSAILKNPDGSFLALCDNGFGSIENSRDFRLRVYTIQPYFKTKDGGKGDIKVIGFIELSDPDRHIPFAITNHFSKERMLTGADFDLESMQRTEDGTLWFGDEFGPFLLHTDSTGKLLEPPIPLPDFDHPGLELRSPQNPFNEEGSVIRIMNALQMHGNINKSKKPQVVSPWYLLLNENIEGVPDRLNPPQGLAKASSKIFDVQSLKRAGFQVIPWTINEPYAMETAIKSGVNGIISDRPDLLWEVVSSYDSNKDGTPDFLDKEGLININLLDAQAHRGGRGLRPENTLPAMEAGLDYLMTTLETDAGITKDGIAILNHDPHIEALKARHLSNKTYSLENQVLIKNCNFDEIQNTFIADKLLKDHPFQKNDKILSPVSSAFAKANKLMDPYVMPSLQQLFDFVNFYSIYYKTGPGKNHPQAEKRWKNAERVRFNIETKINPRTDRDENGEAFTSRTFEPEVFARTLGELIMKNNLEERATIQSFDFRTLLLIQQQYPQIGTVCLFGDFPKTNNSANDGGNLQDQNGSNTPWLGGLFWPYRVTKLSNPFKIQESGGFEGLGYDKNSNSLLMMMERPFLGNKDKSLWIYEFDLKSKRFTGKRYKYVLEDKGTSIGALTMLDADHGLVIERDHSQGDLNGFKAVFKITLKDPLQPVEKKLICDLMHIQDPYKISNEGLEGDIGLGKDFAFPFTTIESIIALDENHIGILNDNNYPFSVGRHLKHHDPDDTEFIIIRISNGL